MPRQSNKKRRFVRDARGRVVTTKPVLMPAAQRDLPQGGNADADTEAQAAAAAGHESLDSTSMDVDEETRDGKDEDWHDDANCAQGGGQTILQFGFTAHSAARPVLFSATRSSMHIDSEVAPHSIVEIAPRPHRSTIFRRKTELLDASKRSMSKFLDNWLHRPAPQQQVPSPQSTEGEGAPEMARFEVEVVEKSDQTTSAAAAACGDSRVGASDLKIATDSCMGGDGGVEENADGCCSQSRERVR